MTTAIDAAALDEAAGAGHALRVAHLLTTLAPWSIQVLDDALATALDAGHTVVADLLVAQGAQPASLPIQTWQVALDDPRLTSLAWLAQRANPSHDDSLPLRLAMGQRRWAAARLLAPRSQVAAQASEALRHGLDGGAPLDLLQALVAGGADLAGTAGHLGEGLPAATLAWVLGQVEAGPLCAQLRQRERWAVLDALLLLVDPATLDVELGQGGKLPQAQQRQRALQRADRLAQQPTREGRARPRS